MSTVKNRIDAVRLSKQISINDFCKAVKISRKTYYNYKNGAPIPSDKLIGIARLCNCSVDYLLGLKDFTQICVTDDENQPLCLITNNEVVEHEKCQVIFSKD